VQKYPPSLLFLMMTLGPALMLLARWERYNRTAAETGGQNAVVKFFVTFGRVPLFFYLLQWLMAHTAGLLLNLAAGNDLSWLFTDPSGWGTARGGFDLWVVYVAWIVGVLLLYPLCRWYAGVKARRRDWWLSYL
jgi:hypothetical protein